MFRYRSNAFTVMVLLCVACSDAPIPTTPLSSSVGDARLTIVSGDGQSGVVGKQLAAPLVVQAVDAKGRPLRSQILNFRVVSGDGSVFAGAALTNQNGIAQELWTIGTSTAAQQKVEVRAVDAATGAALVFGTFTATPLPDAVSELTLLPDSVFSSYPINALRVGTSVPSDRMPKVTGHDQYYNPTPGVQITFGISTPSGTSTFSGGAFTETVLTDAQGEARPAAWTLGTIVEDHTFSASSPVLSFFGSFVGRPKHGPIAQLLKIGDNVVSPAGSVVPVRVQLRDQYGNKVLYDAGETVVFSIVDGGGCVAPANALSPCNATRTQSVLIGYDEMSVNWKLGPAAGPNTLRVEALPVAGLHGSVVVTFSATGT